MKKRIKLKSKHGIVISVLIGLIYCIILFSILVVNSPYPEDAELPFPILIFIMIIGVSMIACIIYVVLDLIFNFKEDEKKDNTFLNKEAFTEVFYTASNSHTSEGKMILSILEKEEIKFFAKLTDDENILLVVRNRNDEDIYRCEISSFYYFENRFLKEKN